MSGGALIYCAALFLTLTSVSRVKNLNSINDLKTVHQSVSEHTLVLLYWFANAVEIDSNNQIWLNFDPNQGDYGSHHYGNYEGMLDGLPFGQRYYTIGNIHQESSVQLPSYVVNQRGRNKARIIVSLREPQPGRRLQRIDRVYITQHYENFQFERTQYDPDHTFEISTNLLREVRQFSVGNDLWSLRGLSNRYARNTNDFQLTDIRNQWGERAGLWLLLSIVTQKGFFSYQPISSQQEQFSTCSTAGGIRHPQFSYTTQGQIYQNNDDLSMCLLLGIVLVILVLFLMFLSQPSNRRW